MVPIYYIEKTLDAPNGFQNSATWQVLEPESEAKEPEKEDPSLIGPTQKYEHKESKNQEDVKSK